MPEPRNEPSPPAGATEGDAQESNGLRDHSARDKASAPADVDGGDMSIAEFRERYGGIIVQAVASDPALLSAAVSQAPNPRRYVEAHEELHRREVRRLADSMDHGWREYESLDDAVFTLDGDIRRTVDRLIVQDEAGRRLRRLTEPPPKPWDAGTLSDLLMRDPVPPARVDGLMPWEANTLLIAQRKAGKTTMTLNLARSLLTGEMFLGEFGVVPLEGRVGLLNFEVSAEQIAGWAHQVGVPADRLFVVNLRGQANPFGDAERLAALAGVLREQDVEALIVDPFGRAFSGEEQNNTGQVTRWLADLERFAREDVGVKDVVLVAHAGWEGERVRGASALEDWPDSLMYLTRDPKTDARYLRADGRDVEMRERELAFDHATKRLSFSGRGSRTQAKQDRLISEMLGTIRDHPGINVGELELRLGLPSGKGHLTPIANRAEKEGLIRREPGPRNATLHYLADDLEVPREGET